MYEIIEKQKRNNRNYYLVKTSYGLCTIACDKWNLGRRPDIRSAINKTEYFVNQSNEVHDFSFDYSNSVYVDSKTKVEIHCRLGHIFLQSPNSHLQGQGCRVCYDEELNGNGKVDTLNTFVNKANSVHSQLYLYNNFVYVNSRIKSFVTCKIHGNFEQKPADHLQGKGCPRCFSTFRLDNESFKSKANEIHFGRYDYSLVNYSNLITPVLIKCSIHGVFETTPQSHLNGSNCQLCAKDSLKMSLEEFKDRSNSIHKNKYDYSLVKFDSLKDYIDIICPLHSNFSQIANNHLNGNGCINCSNLLLGWTRTNFKLRCQQNNNGLGVFYIIRCFNEDEEFYKVGITSNSIPIRYNSQSSMPYDYEVIQEIKDVSDNVYNFETLIKNYISFNGLKYAPLIKFGGSTTECFQIS